MGARWHIYHPHVKLHLAPLALAALAIQLIAIFAPLGSDDLPRRILLVLSYLTLVVFIAANLRRPGIGVIGAGVWLNFLVIVANGGLMPVTAETLEKTGDVPEDARVGEWISGTKDVLRERDDVRLYFLSDRLAYDVNPLRAFSIGDVFILSGAVLLAGELLLPRVKRVPTT
ncbi:MAG: DUF5317 family protein [Dehalococcoidia bacterium]